MAMLQSSMFKNSLANCSSVGIPVSRRQIDHLNMAVFTRNLRKNLSENISTFRNYFGSRTLGLKLRVNNFTNLEGKRHRLKAFTVCHRSITSNTFSYGHKEGNSQNNNYIKGLLLPAGIFSLFKKKEENEEESELIMTIKRGILLIQKEEFKKAEQMLHLALKLAQEQQSYDGVTYIYDLLANLALEQKEYQKAETLFLDVMKRLISKGVPQNDNKIIHMSLKLANIYRIQGESEKSEQGFKFCVNHLQSAVEKGSKDEDTMMLYAMSLDWYARYLVDAHKFTEAFECFKKAYELCLQINGEIHEETVVLLNDLGTLCIIQNEYDQAISYLTHAVDIGDKLPEMKDYGIVLANLMHVYIKKGMFDEARQFFNKALQNAKKYNNEEIVSEITDAFEEMKKLESGQQ